MLALWTDASAGTVVELPDEALATDVIGAFTEQHDGPPLIGMVCVVDAVHLLDDLHRDDYVALRDADSGVAAPLTARTLLTVMQIEYASTIVFVGWEALPTDELAMIMALVHHLSPFARLRLSRRAIEPVDARHIYTPAQSRPGWMSVLNGDFAAHMTDARVSAFRYEQVRPLHPGDSWRCSTGPGRASSASSCAPPGSAVSRPARRSPRSGSTPVRCSP